MELLGDQEAVKYSFSLYLLGIFTYNAISLRPLLPFIAIGFCMKNNFLGALIEESMQYGLIEEIEKLVQHNNSLSYLPVQPLYMAFKTMIPEKVGLYLEKLDADQRQAFLDIDLWDKDGLDLESFSFWIQSYRNCPNEKIKNEFLQGPEFGLYLKSKLNIWTFDLEEPLYPDHDNYFLTEDNLLLFEFHEDFEQIEEVHELVKDLYSALGVENAYTHLFKYVATSFSHLVEEEYHWKKNRMRDLGFVDYFDALSIDSDIPIIDNFIDKKTAHTGNIDILGKAQVLPKNSIIPFREKNDALLDELSKVEDDKRREFLRFNFIRLINATHTLNNSLKSGSVSMARTGKKTRALIDLGFDYLKINRSSENIFDRFEFEDLYKIGNSLIKDVQGKIKASLKKNNMEETEGFFGAFWSSFLDQSFSQTIKFEEKDVATVESYNHWQERSDLFCQLLPFMEKFFSVYEKLNKSGTLQDAYYLNYNPDDMDFESLLISCFANFKLGHFSGDVNRLGITIDEARKFLGDILNSSNKLVVDKEGFSDFAKSFALNQIDGFIPYFTGCLKRDFEGLDFKTLTDEEFKHIGGLIILNSQ